MTSGISASESIVNFLVYDPVLGLTQDPRAFDMELGTDETSGLTAQQYFIDTINQIQTLMNGTQPLSPSALSTIAKDISNLNAWSQMDTVTNGVETDSSSFQVPNAGPLLESTMTQYMAQALNTLNSTFRAAGWDPTNPNEGSTQEAAAIGALTSPSTSGIYDVSSVFTNAIASAQNALITQDAAATDSQSVQQALIVDYISTGNEVIYNEMSQLQTAVNANGEVLSYLNSLQDLMNQKDPQQFIMQLQNLSTNDPASLAANDTAYDSFETQTYNTQLGTQADFTESNISTYLSGITSTDPAAQQAFAQLNPTMNAGFTDDVSQIVGNLNYLINQVEANGGSSSGQLVTALQTLVTDFNGLTSSDPNNALVDWVQDIQSGTQGDFQNDLNNAVTAAESFNDTEQANLQQVSFLYQEFYQSATGLLSQITQIIQQMATAINSN